MLLYITEQLSITIETYYSYDWNDRLSRYHRQEILVFLRIRKFIESNQEEVQDWLWQTIFSQGLSTSEALEYIMIGYIKIRYTDPQHLSWIKSSQQAIPDSKNHFSKISAMDYQMIQKILLIIVWKIKSSL